MSNRQHATQWQPGPKNAPETVIIATAVASTKWLKSLGTKCEGANSQRPCSTATY